MDTWLNCLCYGWRKEEDLMIGEKKIRAFMNCWTTAIIGTFLKLVFMG